MAAEEYLQAMQDIKTRTLTRDGPDRERFWRTERGGLNPFFGKVILITYQINDAHVHRLKEWEDGEKVILKAFYNLLADLQKGGAQDRLTLVGHNILRFDLFFLYRRMLHHNIADEDRLYQTVLNRPGVVDFLQSHMPLNKFNTRGLKHDVLMHAYGLPTKDASGSEEAAHYYKKEYQKILEYSEKEFCYPEIFRLIRTRGMVTPEQLQESIKWYNDTHETVAPS